MLNMTTSPLEIVVRVVVVYATLFLLMRLVGKKHLSELAPFDVLVLLIVSECVQNSMIGDDTSLTGGLVAASTLFALSYLVGWTTWRSKRASRILDGVPKILVRNGVVDDAMLAREMITRADLMEALRKEGISTFGRVRYAILENDGDIAVAPRRGES